MTAEVSVKSRPYQELGVKNIFKEFQGGKDSTLCVMATGTGKTLVAGETAHKSFYEHGRRTLFLAHTDNLLYQAQNAFSRFGLETTIEMAELDGQEAHFFGSKPHVTLGSVQTLQRTRLQSWGKHAFGLIICDEAHHSRAQSYQNIFHHFKDYWHLGLTATPDRGDGKNLGAVYESVAFEYNLKNAIKDGWLAPIVQVVCKTSVDLSDIRTTGGDFNEGDLSERIAPYIEELVDATINEIGERKTVVFCPDVGSAQAAADIFRQKGKQAAWIAGMPRMNREEQKSVLNAYASGSLSVICGCDKLTEGWDDPPTSAVVIMRPTRKRSRFAQMVGRGTRKSPGTGKTDCMIVNFAWETTKGHELVSPFELFDDSETDDEVMEIAKALAAKPANRERSMMDIFDEAEQEFRQRSIIKIKMSGKKAEYSKFSFDPVGVSQLIGVNLKPDWHLNSGTPLSEKQHDFLRKLGMDSTNGLNRMGASKTIDAMLERRKLGLASLKQVRYAITLGMDAGEARKMSFRDASKVIDELKRRSSQ